MEPVVEVATERVWRHTPKEVDGEVAALATVKIRKKEGLKTHWSRVAYRLFLALAPVAPGLPYAEVEYSAVERK